MYLVLFYWCRE